MQTTSVRSLGFKALTKSVPDSVDEFDSLAKEKGAALREATRNVLYRSTLADFRNSYLHGSDEEKNAEGTVTRQAIVGLDKTTGIDRLTKVTKPEVKEADVTNADGSVTPGKVTTEAVEAWAESEDDFFNRVVATLVKNGDYPSVEAAIADLSASAQAAFDIIPFDPSKSERKSAGPKKTPKVYTDTAAEIVKSLGSIEAAVSAVGAKIGVTIEPTVEALAVAIWKDQTSQAKQKQLADQYSK